MDKTVKNKDIFQMLEEWAPRHLAYDWDNVGLQIGSPSRQSGNILVTLDVVESVVEEAIDKGAGLIIAHHPMLFKPLSEVNMDTVKGSLIEKLILNKITVYAAHTNLDVASGGVNDMLCERIGIRAESSLVQTGRENLYKLAVYVPESHGEAVREALHRAGAGHIGNYSHCMFKTQGIGSFKPLEGTNPFIGSKGELEFVNELKIETVVPEPLLGNCIRVLMESHPYEEPAYDIFPMANEGKVYGIGSVGTIDNEMTVRELGEHIKRELGLTGIRIAGNLDKIVKKVAILGGSGEKYIKDAIRQGADAYITGDMTFHPAQEAAEMGLPVIDAGHYIEKVMKESVKAYLDIKLKKQDIAVFISDTVTDPFRFL